MAAAVDYYLSLSSPWTYLGHERFVALAAGAGSAVRLHPVDFGAVFAVTGGLPLGKRSAQRRAYRMQELARWRSRLQVPLNLEPRYFPVSDHKAACMVLALRERGAHALQFAGACLRAVWVDERDIDDDETLLQIAAQCELDGGALLTQSRTQQIVDLRAKETEQAVARGVFGAPSYLVEEQLLWGQDRLDFVAELLR